MKFIIETLTDNKKGIIYYITINDDNFTFDDSVCAFLNIPIDNFQNELVTKFNGFIDGDVYFEDKEDCKKSFRLFGPKIRYFISPNRRLNQ
jgi:hypothetical protein